MKRRRIFIAINLPEEIKKKLAEYQGKWPELPIRWIKQNNLHITLDFIGYVGDEELLEVCKTTKQVASKHASFDINLIKVCYGPRDKKPPRPPKFSEIVITEENKTRPKKFGRPRMIWAVGEKSEEFTSLKEDLDKSLAVSENREFSPHITLGRIRKWEWQRIEPEERPEVDENVDFGFSVNSIEVMESVLKKRGAEYIILESYNLGPEK